MIRFLRLLLALTSLTAIVAFLVVACTRLQYPFELDWLESGVLDHVRRIDAGEPIYVAPSVDFVSFPYPPLFPALAWVASLVTGIDFAAVRIVSLVAALGTFGCLFHIVRTETSSRFAGMVAVGLFAVCYDLSGAWFDVGKADMLLVFLLILGLVFIRNTTHLRYVLFGGLCFGLAILAKQTGLSVALPVIVYLLATRWRSGLLLGFVTVAVAGLPNIAMNVASNGWYDYIVWQQLREHKPPEDLNYLSFFTRDIIAFLPAIALLALAGKQWLANRWSSGLYAVSVAGLIGGAWISRIHDGAFNNVLMPAFLGGALAAGLSLGHLQRSQSSWMQSISILLCGSIFVPLVYDPTRHIPTADNERAGRELIAFVESIPGDVLVVSHPSYGVIAGKPLYAHFGGASDVSRADNQVAISRMQESYAEAIRSKRFSAVILDDNAEPFIYDNLRKCYQQSDVRIFSDKPLIPQSGFVTFPKQVWMPRPGACDAR